MPRFFAFKHSEKITVHALCFMAREFSVNCPADSAPAFTGIDPVKGFVGGSRANTIFGGAFPAHLPSAHHDFPTVKPAFLRAPFVGISLHDDLFGNWFAADSCGS
jgi:hypothetical protein